MRGKLAYPYSDTLLTHEFRKEHPLTPDRLKLTYLLSKSLGLLDDVNLIEPVSATREEIELLKSEREVEQLEFEKIQQSMELAEERLEAELREREIKNLEQDKRIQEMELQQNKIEERQRRKDISFLKWEKEKEKYAREKSIKAFAL